MTRELHRSQSQRSLPLDHTADSIDSFGITLTVFGTFVLFLTFIVRLAFKFSR